MTFSFRVAAASVVLALAVGGPAQAQQAAAPAPAPTAAAPAAPPAALPSLPAPDVPPEKLAVARQVVLSSGMGRSFEPMVPQLAAQIPMVVTRTRPEYAKDVASVLTQLQPEFDTKTDEMINIAARIYARRLNDDELKATAAFFASPAGKKYVEAQPLMLDELVIAMQAWTQETSTFMMKRVQTEMEKKGDKF